ncbi:MAG: DUF192 domain-containing protein [Pseudomonadota bacterium]
MFLRHIKLWFAGILIVFFLISLQAEPMPQTSLQIGMHVIKAEVVATPESRAKGLMRRTQLDKNSGMLFIFDTNDIHGMWMRNTLLPLSVAFIDKSGAILNIAEMKPLDETTHNSSGPAGYALEMNSGWFSQHGIKAGDKVQGLPK